MVGDIVQRDYSPGYTVKNSPPTLTRNTSVTLDSVAVYGRRTIIPEDYIAFHTGKKKNELARESIILKDCHYLALTD